MDTKLPTDALINTENAFAPNSQFEVEVEEHPAEDAFPQAHLMPQSLAPQSRKNVNPWPPQLIMDLALAIDDQDTILQRHELSEANLAHLYNQPAFRRDVAVLTRELHESGVTFSSRAAVQAEAYLQTMDDIIMNPDTPASTRVDIFKTLTKYGKLEPIPDKVDDSNGTKINVQINL